MSAILDFTNKYRTNPPDITSNQFIVVGEPSKKSEVGIAALRQEKR